MTRFIVGPDGTRYKVVPNALPDPQDYGHVEPVTLAEQIRAAGGRWAPEWCVLVPRELDALAAELEAAKKGWDDAEARWSDCDADFYRMRERAEAAEKALKEARLPTLEHVQQIYESARLRAVAGPCLNCGSREQTVVCADCGRLNPAEEQP